MNNILVGCDPELFLQNGENKFISSIGKFGGTKLKPAPIGGNCFVQEDNVAVEFNIPPAHTLDEFQKSIDFSLAQIAERAKTMNLVLAIVPAAQFDKDQLRHPKARVFGCDPDFNAWTKTENRSPMCEDKALRSAGGHVHVGCVSWMNDNPLVAQYDIARAMDVFLGVPSVVLDKDTMRRKLYGKAGAFRPKEYGIEYRTLSNFWIRTPALREWVYKQTMKAMEFLDLGNLLTEADGKDIQKCINESDPALAFSLMDKYGLETAYG